MRSLFAPVAIVLLSATVPVALMGQGVAGLSITNYRFVSEQRISQTNSYVTYRADLVNSGPARGPVTATVSSTVPNLKTVPGQTNLHFPGVPANGQVTSSNTFTIQVDRTVSADFAALQWSFVGPVANAGPNQTAGLNSTVTLNGSGSSNPSGVGSLTYSWAFTSRPAGSTATLSNPTSVSPTFVVDKQGSYVIALTVSNGVGTDTTTVTVTTGNSAPVANAGPDQTVPLGATVTLSGAASSDVDGNPLTYSWLLISRPATSTAILTGANSVSPTFIADKPGDYVAQLIVNDGQINSTPDTVKISTSNTAPVANAGPGQTVNVGALVQLNGAGSSDVDGNPLTYRWSLVSRPATSTATLSSLTAVNPTFTADKPGDYVAQLIVNDGQVDSAPSTVTISTSAVVAPTANAGNPQTVARRATVTLSGSGTDPQNLPLTYSWSLTTKPNGSTAVLSSTTITNPTFVADLPGQYVAQLIVNNGVLSSNPSTVTITTTNSTPTAAIGVTPGTSVFVGTTVTLNGSGSTDPDSDPLTYAWSLTTRPNGSTAALSSTTAVAPTLFTDLAGTYIVQLIVSDGFASSAPVTVMITAGPKTITLTPDPLNLSLSAAGTLTVTLSAPAPAGGQQVFLNSSNPAVFTVPISVTVPEAATGTNVTVTPISVGSGSITATSTGSTPASVNVNVSATTLSLTVGTSNLGLTQSTTGTVTLASPAPAGGLVVTLTSAPPGIVTIPATVTVGAGALTATFQITGAAVGSTTIQAAAAGYTNGTASVTVAALGTINLASGVTVGLGQTVPFAVTLSSPATSAVTVNLASSDTTKLTISPASVTIAAGQVSPTTQPTVTGVATGSATINATAAGYTSGSQSVTINATMSFSTPTPIGVGSVQNLTLTLSGPAPAGGLLVSLNSANTSVATVPANVTIAAGATTVQVPVTGVAVGGPVTITASTAAPNIPNATAAVTVVLLGTINLPANTAVGLGQSTPINVTLSTPAVSPVTVNLSSSDTTKVTIAPSSVTIATGQTTPASQPVITGVSTGGATITATATGWTSGTGAVTVNATMSFSTPSPIGVGSVQNLTLTLSGAAPAGGLTVNLASSNSAVASVPASVSFAAGATTVQVPVTGVAVGGPVTITASTSAPNIPNATANVSVVVQGSIGLPANTSVGLGQSTPLTVTLSVAAPSNVTVNLASSDTTKVTVSPASVTILAGQTTPTTQPTVTGVGTGSATINATATGWTSGSGTVTVNATMSFSTPTPIGVGSVQNLTLTLSGAAPAGGITVNLSSSNSAVASVPASVSFAAGATTVQVPVTGVAAGGPVTITATSAAPNIPNATASVTVVVLGSISIPPTTSVNLGQTKPIIVTLSAPAPADTTVTLVSSDNTKVAVTGSILIQAGQTTPATQAQITGVNVGNVTITATAPGWTNGSGTVVSGAVVTFSTPAPAVTVGNVSNLTLNLSAAAPAGGLTVSLSSGNVGIATVPNTATFAAGSTTVLVPVTGVATGSTAIHASGTNIPDSTIDVVVSNLSALIGVPSISVGKDLEAPISVTISNPAPPSGQPITLTSSDPSKLLIAGRPGDVGTASLVVSVLEGLTSVSGIYLQALDGTGTVTVTATSPGYSNGTGTITLTPSGFVMAVGTNSVGQSPSYATNQGVTTPVVVSPARLDAAGNFVETQLVRPSLTVSVPIASSNPTIGTITPGSLNFVGGTTASATANFRGVAVGSTTVTVGPVPNFTTPAGAASSVTFNVAANQVVVPNATVGVGLAVPLRVSLQAPGVAPTNTVFTVTSNDPSKLLFATSPGGLASASIPITMEAGRNATVDFYGLGLVNSGTVTYTATGGIGSATGTITLAPSAVIIAGPNGFGNPITTTTGSGPQAITAFTYYLDGSGFPVDLQVVGGTPVNFTVVSSNTSVGTISNPNLTIGSGASSATTNFNPVGVGSSTVSVSVPSGFSAPAAFGSVNATVVEQRCSLPGAGQVLVGKNLQGQSSVILSQPAQAGGVDVTLTSNDPGKLLLAASPNNIGTTSIVVHVAAGSNNASYYLQALDSNTTATFGCTAPGYGSGTGSVELTPSAVIITPPDGPGLPFMFAQVGVPVQVKLSTAQVDAAGFFSQIQPLIPGASVTVNITATPSPSGAGTVQSPVTITGPADTATATFTGTAAGNVTLTPSTPPGYTTPATNSNDKILIAVQP